MDGHRVVSAINQLSTGRRAPAQRGARGRGSGFLREICHGIDILSHKDPTTGVWARVAGDTMDGVLLGIAAAKTRDPAKFVTTAALVGLITVADLFCARRLSAR